MGNETRWYATRDMLRAAFETDLPFYVARALDTHIEAASQAVEELTNRRYIPETKTVSLEWPQRDALNSYSLELPEDLLAVTALTKDGDDAVAIDAGDFFLEPSALGPPYSWIELDRATAAYFSSKNTPQRALRIAGRWAYSEDTRAAGALAEADDGSETALQVTDSGKVGIGDTMLIGTEALFVSGKSLVSTTATLNGGIDNSKGTTSVVVDDGTKVKVGEVITVDSERMLVEDIATNTLIVQRAIEGTAVAAHLTAAVVYAPRDLTVVRGVNGTTAAAHDSATAIAVYAPPGEIVRLVRADALARFHLDRGGWTGQLGGGEGVIEGRFAALEKLRDEVRRKYIRHPMGAV